MKREIYLVGAAMAAIAAIGIACSGGSTSSSGSSGGGGAGQTISPKPIGVAQALASDGTSVYWIDSAGDTLSSIPVGGGAATTVFSGQLGRFLFADSANVYFINNSVLEKLPKGDTAPTPISPASAATILGTTVYWIDLVYPPPDGGVQTFNGTATVYSEPVAGGASTTISSIDDVLLVSDLAVTSDAVFVAAAPSLGFMPKTGGPLTEVTGLPNPCTAIASDTDGIYCGGLMEVAKISSDGTVTMLESTGLASAIALDATSVYYVDNEAAGAIRKISKQGGTPTTIATDVSPLVIAVDDAYVYWGDNGGNIMRAPK